MYCRPVTIAMEHGETWERAPLQACRPPRHPRRHPPGRPLRLLPCHGQYPRQILAAPTPPLPPRVFHLYCTIVLLYYCTVTVVVLYASSGSFILRVLSSVPKPPLLRPTAPESSAIIILSLSLILCQRMSPISYGKFLNFSTLPSLNFLTGTFLSAGPHCTTVLKKHVHRM